MNKIKIVFILAVVAVGGIYYYTNSRSQASQEITVTLTADGFRPVKVDINKGDTVVFKSELGKPFWPASDLHPSHTIYSEFDPKQPIEASSVWSFKFEKKGSWKYHDHLFPLYRGTIVVE